MSVDSQKKELNAFFSYFATFDLARPVTTIADLSDGAALFEILSIVDAEYFRQPGRPAAQPSDNWVLRFSALKKLYRLMTQYFSEVLHQPTGALEVPDLQAIAKDYNVNATLILCRLTIAIAVQCENNKEIIERIQKLTESEQHALMRVIEQTMTKVRSSAEAGMEASMTECVIRGRVREHDHYYQIQSERSRILSEKETLEKVYQSLLEEHRTLQTNYDDVVSEKDDALAQLRQAQREADSKRVDTRGDAMMRGEIDRLRADLQKSEDNLAMAESELDKQTVLVTELTRKVDELQVTADEATRLKDQLDEYRHAADKLQKTENVMEKYKKKLQEAADMRQQVKALEKQNADLVDKNAALEDEYRKVAAFKPLMESYKSQIAELETKASARSKEIDALNFELAQTKSKLKAAQEERAKDSETLELYQERVRELELTSQRPVAASRARSQPADSDPTGNMTEFTEAELLGNEGAATDVDDDVTGLGDELDTAIAGTTMTDLKLQVRKLQRELEAVRKNEADASRVLVLENLLDDANRMKARYEADYLAAHREKLMLQNNLEEIRSGKSLGDGAEAAIALRQRLNETVDELDKLKQEHAELAVKFEAMNKELTVAKSDLTLVNRDQLDILKTLRESVNEDKAELEAELDRLRTQVKELSDKNKMQLEQINGLLLEKVNLQSEGIDQRDRMLQRERAIGDLRASLSGKDVPEDIKQRMLALHEENVSLKEQYKTAQEKLVKAKAFIKQQDKLFKEEHAKAGGTIPTGAFEEAETSYRSQIRILEDDLARQKRLLSEATNRYRREQALMLGAIHNMGMHTTRDQLGYAKQQSQPGPTSWLKQQRQNVGLDWSQVIRQAHHMHLSLVPCFDDEERPD
ncbi:HOOK-domain-containing protein [Dichomitus squalens LYAD-421 SS1]|uniref:HOOK-domain-containing protein n=1 Tax=Dichomitus squalens (strain LYAD-421) TaxID=732165 RepID=UPI00044138CA|nr:HOOK-domain-containing protein [Dichomitus squalens LYAD-421 SS1]EJF62459.1 HOOK-domain-containing protein [Dichomitus squalens LYAD-421 SS1]